MPVPRSERLLLIEDDPGVSEVLKLLLVREGYRVDAAGTVKEGVRRAGSGDYDLVVTDLKLPDGTGLDALRLVHESNRAIPVVLMTSYSSLESAIAALRAGAVDYIIKPFDNLAFLHAVERALNERRMSRENAALRRALANAYAQRPILGDSPGIEKALERMRKAAASDANVLISGEYGTGKELLAHALHARGARAGGPFVPVKCGALAPAVLDAELFGRGSGAERSEGLLREARGGTLYLAEISELTPALQVKLLRVLQDKVVVSGVETDQPAAIDVRFVAATHWDLEEAVAKGSFRQDLYYRLNVISLMLPPLRDRGGDVLLLARHFAEHYSRKLGKAVRGFDPEFTSFLQHHPWPGNVRELEQFIERAIIFAEGSVLTGRDLAEVAPALPMVRAVPTQGLHQPLAIEEYIRAVVERFQDTRSEAELAKMLGIGRKALWARRRQWGLKRMRQRSS